MTIAVLCDAADKDARQELGDPVGDPQGILRGSNAKTGDPGFSEHVKIGGPSETTIPLYKIKKRKEGE